MFAEPNGLLVILTAIAASASPANVSGAAVPVVALMSTVKLKSSSSSWALAGAVELNNTAPTMVSSTASRRHRNDR